MGQETKEKKIQEVNNDIPPFKPKNVKEKMVIYRPYLHYSSGSWFYF